MSYHLAMRSLQSCNLAPGVGSFADCIEHSLSGEHSAFNLRLEMQNADHRRVSLTSIVDRLGKLLAVDLNPVGQVLRLATKDVTYRRTWDFFNRQGNVVLPIGYSGANHFRSKTVISIDAPTVEESISDCHEKLVAGYHDVLMHHLEGNRNPTVRRHKQEDGRVSAVARILGAGSLAVDLSEFFEEFPAAKVSQAYQHLSVHPRLAERQLHQLGITAVKIKRACMLARATHQILGGDRPFSDIAITCGYAHGAHLAHAVSHATGGMAPSFIRSLVST